MKTVCIGPLVATWLSAISVHKSLANPCVIPSPRRCIASWDGSRSIDVPLQWAGWLMLAGESMNELRLFSGNSPVILRLSPSPRCGEILPRSRFTLCSMQSTCIGTMSLRYFSDGVLSAPPPGALTLHQRTLFVSNDDAVSRKKSPIIQISDINLRLCHSDFADIAASRAGDNDTVDMLLGIQRGSSPDI